jgi:hypothetical protein
MVVLDRSIGGISIGMRKTGVVTLLGMPSSRLAISLGGGKSGLTVRYRAHGAPLLITYDRSGRVVAIEAYSSFYRTVGGLGPGSMLTRAGALHDFKPDFCEFGYWNGNARSSPNRVVTVFTPSGGLVASVMITEFRFYTACAAGSHESPPPA